MADFTHIARRLLLASTALVLYSGAAQAQFCPAFGNPPVQQGGNGFCTNNANTGAFSNAALASQGASDLSQANSQATTNTASNALAERRETERQRCPAGTERVGGTCRPTGAGAERPAAAPERRPAERRVTRSEPRVAEVPVYKSPVIVEPAIRYGSWVQGFGEYERRTGRGTAVADAILVGAIATPLALSVESRSTMGGVLGGADMTWRNFGGNDGSLMLGVMGGFTSTHARLNAVSISANPATLGNGSSTTTVNVTGGGIGAYATYFTGRFSADASFRADFLSLDESWVDNMSFNNPANAAGAPIFITQPGSGSTRLTNYTFTANLNYRVPLSMTTWIEPTVGTQYTVADYAGNAAVLGLADGHVLRLQAGARYGSEFMWDNVHVTGTVTGLVYDNVDVQGGFVQNIAFGSTNGLILQDEGKLRGQGIVNFKFDYGNGYSSFVQADVRGGQNLFAGGGKAGVRYEWGGPVIARY